MSLREKWSFTFSVAQLSRAAREKAQYHRKHERDWAKKYAKWNAEMSKSARIEEVPVSGGTQRNLRYDPGLQTKVNEAQTRRDAHKRDADGYERWLRALNLTEHGTTFTLDVDDVAYFGL